jgi:hypothetical protein
MGHCTLCGKTINHSGACNSCREKLGIEQDSSECFIATACYGINSKYTQIFRNWRDKTLLKTSFGRQFVKVYYRVSPPIANFISDKPLLKDIVRAGLFPIKEIVRLYPKR